MKNRAYIGALLRSILCFSCIFPASSFADPPGQQSAFCSDLNQGASGAVFQGGANQQAENPMEAGLKTMGGTPKSGPRAVEDLNVNTLPTIKVDKYNIKFKHPDQTEIGKDVRCLAIKLAKICQGDLEIISGYRSPSHNSAVSGAKDSMHMYRRAIDFSCGGKSSPVLAKMAGSKEVGCTGVGTYCGSTSHCDTRNQKTEWNWCHAGGKSVFGWAESAFKSVFAPKDQH